MIQDCFKVKVRVMTAGKGLKVCLRERTGNGVQIDDVPDHETVMPGACKWSGGSPSRLTGRPS
jgi:hypothetical protein